MKEQFFPAERPIEGLPAGREFLTENERRAITDSADMRRRDIKFRIEAAKIKSRKAIEIPAVEEAYQQELTRLFEEVASETSAPAAMDKERLSSEARRLIEEAKKNKNTSSNLAALKYAKSAKIQLSIGEDFRSSLDFAKSCIDISATISKETPSALMPEAILLNIEKALVKKEVLPRPEKVASAILDDKKLLKDYSLTLREEDRELFLDALPKNKRREVSAFLDRELSKVLKFGLISGESERLEHQRVHSRSTHAMEEIIQEASPAERPVIKALSETLLELETEESKRVLLELGKKAIFSKDREGGSIAYAARILKNLAEVDISKAGNLAMKFMAKKEVAPRYFGFFAKDLIKKEYFTKNLDGYLEGDNNLPFLKRLIAEYPNQFNTVIDTISKISDYSPDEHEEEIFDAIKTLDSITPIIFNRYRLADAQGKKELARQIKELKPRFFRNIPIKEILPKKDREILAEMVYLAYKPINMSFAKVEGLIKQLNDQTEDLKKYQFPIEGYDFSLGGQSNFSLKEGESLDMRRLEEWKRFLSFPYPDDEKSTKTFSALLVQLSKSNVNLSAEDISRLFSIMGQDESIADFLDRYGSLTNNRAYGFLQEIKEIFGIYFDDHYGDRLTSFLGANPSVLANVSKVLAKPEKIQTLKSQLGKLGEGVNWQKLDDRKEVARLLALFLGNKVLKSVKGEINSSIKKFIEENGSAFGQRLGLKLHVSKNVGSFFAKASAGICTAEDIPLFERDDHFHMNVVENDAYVRANIQAYLIQDSGGTSLVLRGFNPNTDFLDKIDAKEFCEKVIEVAKKFQQDNGLRNLYITEQGGWHALSNRNEVANYLSKKYAKEANSMSYNLQVSSSHNVGSLYKIYPF